MTTETQPLRGPLRKRDSSIWSRDPHDFYVEPEWCSERLFEAEQFRGEIWDPACGTGRIIRSAGRVGLDAVGTDLVDRGFGGVHNFMTTKSFADNIVSNPPFGIAGAFVRRALDLSARKVAMLLPANWVQGDKRSRWLETTPLVRVYFLTPRPSMPPGTVIQAGVKPGNGTTDYAWFVWDRGYQGPAEIGWIRRDA